MREPLIIWEERLMAFKGSKPDKGGDKSGGLVEQMQRTLDVQSRVIEALARALEAACATEVEADDDEDEDKDENEEEEDK